MIVKTSCTTVILRKSSGIRPGKGGLENPLNSTGKVFDVFFS